MTRAGRQTARCSAQRVVGVRPLLATLLLAALAALAASCGSDETGGGGAGAAGGGCSGCGGGGGAGGGVAASCGTGGPYSPTPGDIPLALDAGAMPDSGCYPLGTGVPLRRGQLAEAELGSLAVAGASQGKVPAAFEVRARWPDGSVKWLWVDFLAARDSGYYLVMGGGPGPEPEPAVQVSQAGGELGVDSGALELRFASEGASPVEVRRGGQVVATGDGLGVYLLDQDGQRATLGGAGAELDWQVETQSVVRAVLRVEGWYTTEAGEPVARAVVRYHLWAGQPWMRVEHTLVVTGDTRERWFSEVGLSLPLDGGAQAVLGGQDGEPVEVALSGADDEAYIFQQSYPHFHHGESLFVAGHGAEQVGSGEVAAGWAALEKPDAGLVVAVREMAQQYPTELRARPGELSALLWSSRDGWQLDYAPATLVDRYWGPEWVDLIPETRPAEYQAILDHYGFDDADGMRALSKSAAGVARTHELLVGYYGGAAERQAALGWAEAAETPPITYPDPSWTVGVDPAVLPPMAAKGEVAPEYEDLERFSTAWLDTYLLMEELWPHASWYDWGETPHLNYAMIDGALYAMWYRLHMFSSYGLGYNLWRFWARSGDRTALDAAERLDRRITEYGVAHWDGDQYVQKGQLRWGLMHLPITWSGSTTLHTYMTHRLQPLAYEYLFRDKRPVLDALRLTRDAHLQSFTPDWDTTKCGEMDVLTNVMALYRVFGEPFDTMAKELFEAATDPDESWGLSQTYYGPSSYCSSWRHHERYRVAAIVDFYDLFGDDYQADGDDYARRVVERATSDICLDGYDSLPVDYTETRAAMCARLYRLTGDASALEPMFFLVNSLRDMFARFEALPPEERGIDKILSSTDRCDYCPRSYWFDDCVFHTWKSKDDPSGQRGTFSFTADTNASALYVVPTVLALLPEVQAQNTGASACGP